MSDSSFVQRAELLADLGRYDEAAAELAEAEPADAAAQTLLARVRLAEQAPREALAAAEAAVAAAPHDVPALIVRGMALAELGRVDEAAEQAEQILRRGRGDPHACTSAAAILAQVRAGQVALDAAWEGVRLAPQEPRAHLVLGLVAAKLGLDEIAGRAYDEALALDPELPVAPAEAGLLRHEQQRYAAALARFAKPDRAGGGRPESTAGGPHRSAASTAGRAGTTGDPAAGAGAGAGFEAGFAPEPAAGDSVGQLRRMLRRGGKYALLAALVVGWAHLSDTAAPLVGLVAAGVLMVIQLVGQRRLSEPTRIELAARLPTERGLLLTLWALLAVPMLLFFYALFAVGWLIVAAGLASVAALMTSRPPSQPTD